MRLETSGDDCLELRKLIDQFVNSILLMISHRRVTNYQKLLKIAEFKQLWMRLKALLHL